MSKKTQMLLYVVLLAVFDTVIPIPHDGSDFHLCDFESATMVPGLDKGNLWGLMAWFWKPKE
jgi:hypothetical protein